ncbi:MAG TPA: DUF2027 domain-containing protein [Bacteroidia bacterium]|nr:DUF2027 domain-containing protein [Bacteroidia bacterium]HRH08435.1 DUF2027 domain-containing protein [Bacteroidia bacterium]HRH64166.1 DUF2027 domain-containing protein [Bacteroidia bacterium]
MPFSVGDKVRFLNSKEKGKIARILSNETVLVDVEGGFEIPVAISELVMDSFPVKETKKSTTPSEPIVPDASISVSTDIVKLTENKKNKLVICFEAFHETQLTASDLILSCFNSTEYGINLTCFRNEDGQFKLLRNAVVEPDSTVVLDTLKRAKLNELRELCFQLIFFKKQKFDLIPPVQSIVKIKQDKLFIEKYFEKVPWLKSKAVTFEVYNAADQLTIPESMLREHIQNSKVSIKDNFKLKEIKLHQSRVEEREVDLHIEELVDNTSGMSNAQIVQLQLSHLQKELDEAIAQRLKKLIVIHGIGTGRLKAEVYKALQNYPKLKYQDASYAKYGFGATEILIY